jgi:hypothetical protein
MNDVRFLENKFSNEIQKHISMALPNLQKFYKFRPSTDEEDSNLSFDLVFNLDFTISVRIRKHKYLRYEDLTIRSKSKYNNKTEIDKIMEGKAQVYFYAYMNEAEDKLVKVFMADVEAIRKLTFVNDFEHKINNDNTEFYTYKFKDIKWANGSIYQFN